MSNPTTDNHTAEAASQVESAIKNRRSVKPQGYNGKVIESALIDRLIEAANWAPTHGLTEPWRFIIFDGDGIKRFCKDHAELYKAHTDPENFMQASYDKLKNQGDNASHIIAVFSKRGPKSNITELEEICATACAVQNILLTAEALGISSFWSTGGQTLKPAMKQYFQLLPEDQMIGLIYLGYTEQTPAAGRRLTPIEEKVMWYHR
ncbi:Nitroreductase [Arachidicoccus rhizosphaerae]|uniref:Putative NAD(P)H nitroreductase n=1 Tax=Arachidicoccus rhizosphaerae TaxID=551991 RepID=A0A1H3YJ14_9BACT|nr:nitroreductase [Arachidicoccus rhizosphaerae]SEA10908.1 Nitroreductase [Arachidicoccus rhizosphaerae]